MRFTLFSLLRSQLPPGGSLQFLHIRFIFTAGKILRLRCRFAQDDSVGEEPRPQAEQAGDDAYSQTKLIRAYPGPGR